MEKTEKDASVPLLFGLILAVIGLVVSLGSLWFALPDFMAASLGVQLQMLLPLLVFLVLILTIYGAIQIDSKFEEA